jgi:hypothetical protein
MFAIKGTKSAFAVMDPTGHFPTAEAKAIAKKYTEALADTFDNRVPVLLAHAKSSGRFRDNIIQAVGVAPSPEKPNGSVIYLVKFGQTCSYCGFGENGIDVKTFTAGNMLHAAKAVVKEIESGVMEIKFTDVNDAIVIPARTAKHPGQRQLPQAKTQG